MQGTSFTGNINIPLERTLGAGVGVIGTSGSGIGVQASSETGIALQATSNGGNAISATSTADTDAIIATSSSPNHAAVSGWNNSGGFGLWASSAKTGGKGGIGLYATGAKYAAQFDGNIVINGNTSTGEYAAYIIGGGISIINAPLSVSGDIRVTGDVVLTGADCAEEFDIAEAAEIDPGTVMVLTEHGALQPSQGPYDKRVAGVISGAGDYKPGLILGRRTSLEKRMPLALVGRVYCKADAQYGAIKVGDLLTTSPTPGYAMRAADPLKAFGAVLGKALQPLLSGQGLVPMLIALQ